MTRKQRNVRVKEGVLKVGKLKEKYADELIRQMENVKHGAWVDWVDQPSKNAVIEVCQNIVEDWCGRNIDHVQGRRKADDD